MKVRSWRLGVGSFILFIFMLSFVSAGVGISWDKESSLVPEKTKTCLTYKIYNPWPTDTYAKIELSEELKEIISSQESESKFIPKHTSSSEAIPVTFCFKTPVVYERDCLIGDSLICKQDCSEEMKTFEGDVNIIELNEEEFVAGGAGGSKTAMSVSAPLRVRVQCVEYKRDYSIIYLAVALIAGILLIWSIIRKKKKPTKKKKRK